MVRIIVVFSLFLCAVAAVFGQVAPGAVPPPPSANWVPPGFANLSQRAAFHTDFTFDRSMLQLAGNFVSGDPQTRAAIGKLDSITVHSYHFAAPGMYDPAMLALVRQQYEAAGWRHLVATHGKGDPFSAGQTDLWINFAHMDVTGMMVLVSGGRDLNLVSLNGDLSTVDLLHLRGHFGIPRFPADGFTPPPSAPGRQPYVPPSAAPEQSLEPSPDQYPKGGVGVSGDSQEVEPAPPPPTPPGM